jgi:tol-pal system protein YbgF
MSSPLLLGQSFLEKHGAWGIDSQRQVLVIHPNISQTLTGSPPSQLQGAATPPASMTPRPSVEGAGADQLYRRALKDYQEHNYEAAVVNLKQFLKQAPSGHPQAGNAQYLTGEALYTQWQYEAAIVAFDAFVQKYSSDPKVPAAMLKQGYAFAELQNVRMARFVLQQVQKKFPNSPEAKVAAEKLRLLR